MTNLPGSEASTPSTAGARRGVGLPFRPRVPETLRTLYEQYCATEARELLALLPREGRRALLRSSGAGGAPLSVEAVHQLARQLLPLPPYEAWVPAYLANRGAYLERLGIASVPARDAPVTVAIRPMANGWWAHLNLRRTDVGWVGFLSFHGEGDRVPPAGGVRRTAEIFREEDAERLRTRFLQFDAAVIEGFLRSATP